MNLVARCGQDADERNSRRERALAPCMATSARVHPLVSYAAFSIWFASTCTLLQPIIFTPASGFS